MRASAVVLAQATPFQSKGTTLELEEALFVQKPESPGIKGGIELLWIPPAVQKYCMGKTHKQCSTVDYCIRTTNCEAAMCQNLGLNVARLPRYPTDVRPKRVLSITYFPVADFKGADLLRSYFERAPADTLNRLSTKGQIKARVRLTRSADDDDFDVLEILSVPPL